MGLFYPFVDDASVQMHGVEAAGHGLETDSTQQPFPKEKLGFYTER